jgi:hypothetical protein
MGQCVNELRLTQCLSSKALRPSADCGFVPQCHPDKSSVARYFIDKSLHAILFADETWCGTSWPTVTVVLN